MTSTIRDLTELLTVAANDYLLISDTSDVTNRDKRISQVNLIGGALTGGGTLATGGFTLTVPATGTAALRTGTPAAGRVAGWADANTVNDGGFALSDISRLSVAQSFSALKTFNAGINLGDENLSVYDEGTFTPTLSIGAGGSTGITYSAQIGTYTRIGRMVFFFLDLRLSSKGVNTGFVSIASLPFSANGNSAIAWGRWTNFALNIGGLMSQTSNTTALSMSYLPAGGASTVGLLSDAQLTNTSSFLVAGIYYV